jgi:hypothetical protein
MSTRSGSDAVNPTGSAAPGCSAGDEGRSGRGVAGDVCAAERAGDALGSPVSGCVTGSDGSPEVVAAAVGWAAEGIACTGVEVPVP